jgi:hypothetical protein
METNTSKPFTVTAVRVGNLTEYEVGREGDAEIVAVLHDADLARAVQTHADLHAALSALLAFVEEATLAGVLNASEMQDNAACAEARAALAKARGQ